MWALPTSFTALGVIWMFASTYRLTASLPFWPLPSVSLVRVGELGLAFGSASVIVRTPLACAEIDSTVLLLTVTVQVAVLPPPKETDGPQVVAVWEAGSLSVTEMFAVVAGVAESGC